jgi:hypothetical protein
MDAVSLLHRHPNGDIHTGQVGGWKNDTCPFGSICQQNQRIRFVITLAQLSLPSKLEVQA